MQVSRCRPMPVKHWAFAGLILTTWCNARCASCYLNCGPHGGDAMDIDFALECWEQLAGASPPGCRIHLTGGEPFGDWPKLLEVCRRAHEAGLSSPGGRGPLEKVETNAFWAVDEAVVRDRIRALDSFGMGKLAISADPFHQQFVPIERCRQAARVAQEVLGPGRVQVRWRDWLADGFDTGEMPQQDRDELFARYAAGGRDRWNGRAADTLAAQVAELLQTEEGREKREERRERREEGRSKRLISSPFSPLPSSSCGEALLRGRHVHVDGNGIVSPGVCAGIVLGRVVLGESGDASSCNKKNALTEAAVQALPCGSRLNGSNCGSRLNEVPAGTICELWHGLEQDHAARPVVGALARGGPAALLEAAKAVGYVPRSIYAGKCHLCREIRRYLYQKGLHRDELGPPGLYD